MLVDNQKVKNVVHLHYRYMPLWYNSILELEYRKEWENKGYHIVGDILKENGERLMKRELNKNKKRT